MAVENGWAAHRVLDDGRVLAVAPQIFTYRLVIGPVGAGWIDDCWCYHDLRTAVDQVGTWDGVGEPTGWHRHPFTGRRRPDGDPAGEYINL